MRDAPLTAKHALWVACANEYTREDPNDKAKSVYRALNAAIRADDGKALMDWAGFVGVLLFGNTDEPRMFPYLGALAPPHARTPADTTTTVHLGFTMPAELLERYALGTTFFWQSFVSCSKSFYTAEDFTLGGKPRC